MLLASSVVLNVLLYHQAKVFYIEMNAIRLDPLGLSRYSVIHDNQDMEKVVIFYGDSRAYDWPAPDIDGLAFVNRGIPGETSAQSALRFDYHIGSLNPGIIILQVGINDLTDVGFMPEQYEEIVENCKANIAQIVGRARAMDAVVVVTTIFPVG
ncbi:MAG: hypothetical protein JXA42_02515, partial [Anaerolineales bacterium]|nr:hypothetical protein [Anaerolineales bacterium]